jgi:hypothetical protein
VICWIPAFYSLTYGRDLLPMTVIVSFFKDKTNKKKFSYSPATSAALPLDANQLLGETDDLRLVQFWESQIFNVKLKAASKNQFCDNFSSFSDSDDNFESPDVLGSILKGILLIVRHELTD